MKQRALPRFQLESTAYLVDVDFAVLRQEDNQTDVLPFNEMEEHSTHYAIPDHRGQVLTVPPMVRLDPEGMAAKYGLAVTALPDRDDALRCPPEALADRLQGKLPIIQLCGQEFFVDLRLGLLRPKDDFSTRGIPLAELEEHPTGTGYVLLYDPATKSQVFYSQDWQQVPEGLVCLELPDTETLDVVGSILTYLDYPELKSKYPFGNRQEALAFAWEPEFRQMIDQYPVREGLEARIIPWEHTGIQERLAENKARQEQKKRAGQKNGKGRR